VSLVLSAAIVLMATHALVFKELGRQAVVGFGIGAVTLALLILAMATRVSP
jgi:hypothetical protein